ncbi:integrase domain-containing protein [Rugamonas aquatica]|uniref:Integrase n=1 Tax=Rugamonas aquatica TaxID=2743357 RepID=A0A6A7N650_9BURK|nr:integrase domain-containing protein [Rugamonas aquatica]MQA40574.1 integrase [Rugamonas aquatica]
MSANPNWKGELQLLLKAHNAQHGVRGKVVSHRTMEARAASLFRSFRLLRQLGYQLGPAALGGRHVRHLVHHWCGLEPPPGAPPATPHAPPPRASSAAYIQQQLSFLRVFAGWIGKPGLVQAAHAYVGPEQRALVQRHQAAEHDHSLSAGEADTGAVLARVAALDPWVGVQLQLMWAFGLRRKEAVMFCPQLAEVPAWALPPNADAGAGYVSFVRVKRGTKGGRLRYTAVRSDEQRAALAAAQALARHPGDHIGRPGLTLKQALERFKYVMRRAGLTRAQLGTTSHGLRHQFANDLYFELTGMPAPVRGGVGIDADAMLEAYKEVARQLGHARPQISGAYLGSPRQARAPLDQPEAV